MWENQFYTGKLDQETKMQPIEGEHMPIIGHGSRGLFGNMYIVQFGENGRMTSRRLG